MDAMFSIQSNVKEDQECVVRSGLWHLKHMILFYCTQRKQKLALRLVKYLGILSGLGFHVQLHIIAIIWGVTNFVNFWKYHHLLKASKIKKIPKITQEVYLSKIHRSLIQQSNTALRNKAEVGISLMPQASGRWERLEALIPLLTKTSIAADWSTLHTGAQQPAGSSRAVTKQGWTSHYIRSMTKKKKKRKPRPGLLSLPFPLLENLITDVHSICSASFQGWRILITIDRPRLICL